MTQDVPLKILAYGKWGTRKTEQAATLVRRYGADHVVFLNMEGGLGTIASALRSDMVIDIRTTPDLRAARKLIGEKYDSPEYWIVVDGATRYFDSLCNEQFRGAFEYFSRKCKGVSPAEMPAELKEFQRYVSARKDALDSMAVYNRVGCDIEYTIASFTRLACNQYWTFLEDMHGKTSDNDKCIPWGPDVPGNVGKKAVLGAFDFVMRYSYDDTGELVASLDPKSYTSIAKTRNDLAGGITVPKSICPFDLSEFVESLRVRQPKLAEVGA